MSFQNRIFIKPIARKAKKQIKVNESEEENLGLTYFGNDYDEIQQLSEDFEGKCIIIQIKDDGEEIETQKKYKPSGNDSQQLKQFIQENTINVDMKIEQKQQNLNKYENIESVETQSNSNYCDQDQDQDYDYDYDCGVTALGEIDYLEGHEIIQKSVRSKQIKNLCPKKRKNFNNPQLLLPKIQQKRIMKTNRIA